jgi:hypothetical protein
MTDLSYQLPLVLYMFPFIDSPLPPLPSVFGAVVEVTIKRTVPTISAPTVTFPLPVILPHLALLSNATSVVDGDMESNFVQLDSVVCVTDPH